MGLNRRSVLDLMLAAAAAAAFLPAAGAARAQGAAPSGEITVMSYAGIFEEQYKKHVIEPFQEKYPDVRVNYFTTGNSAQMLGALRAQKSDPQVDVAIFDATVSLIGNKEGILAPLDVAEVPSLADLIPEAIVQEGYGPAVTLDNLVLVYNAEKIQDPPDSLSVLWDPQYAGQLGVSAMPNIQGIALTVMTAKMVGEDYRQSIDQAVDKLAELAPAVQTFEPTPDGYTMVLNDTLLWATGWNARAQYFRQQSEGKLGILLPAEGSVAQLNTINLVEGAKNRAAALAFIDYALGPEAQKRFTEAMFYAPTNGKAQVNDEAMEKTVAGRMERMIPFDWQWVLEVQDRWNTRWRREIVAASN